MVVGLFIEGGVMNRCLNGFRLFRLGCAEKPYRIFETFGLVILLHSHGDVVRVLD